MNMKTCPKCGTKHTKTGTYCSRKCANSRTFTRESLRKKSESNKNFWKSLSEEEKQKRIKLLNIVRPNDPEKYLNYLFEQDWELLGIQAKRLRVIIEQKGKCNRCGLSEWLGEKITLELEHKDGNKNNNARDNLEALCPNCHSLTKTWRGRKNRHNQKRIEKYLNFIKDKNK